MRRHGLKALFLILLYSAAAAPAPAGESRARPPVINPDGGSYPQNAPVTVSIRARPGERIVYTLDGSIPRPGGGLSGEGHLLFFDLPPGEVRVRARTVAPGLEPSLVVQALFTRTP